MHATHTTTHGAVQNRANDGETIFSLLADRARHTPRRVLAIVAASAGIAALLAAAAGIATWWLLTLCYLAWSFAVWGLVFGPAHPRTRAWRGVELLLVVSDACLATIVAIALFYLALGPRWML